MVTQGRDRGEQDVKYVNFQPLETEQLLKGTCLELTLMKRLRTLNRVGASGFQCWHDAGICTRPSFRLGGPVTS